MKHILFDARKIRDYGIGTYIESLSRSLHQCHHGYRFSSFVPPGLLNVDLLPQGWELHGVRHRQYSLGEFALLGLTISRLRPDLYHATHYTLPAFVPCKTITTIYDIIPLLFPDIFSAPKRAYARAMVNHALRVSERIIVPSTATKESIMAMFPAREEDIIVIPLGVPQQFLGVEKTVAGLAAKQKYQLQRPYILFVSNPKPHKGIETLLTAYARLSPPVSEFDLVFTGGDGKSVSGLRKLVSENHLEKRTRILGRIPGSDIPGLISGADLLVFPSFYEGFGFPLLEAMAVSTPIVCSDAGSLPEVGGDAVCMVSKGSADQLTAGIERVLSDSAYRDTLIERGLERVQQYTWDTCARKTLQCYADVLSSDSGRVN